VWACCWRSGRGSGRRTRRSRGWRCGCSRIRRMRAPVRLLLLFGLLSASAGCGPMVDLAKGLQVLDVSTSWFDAGIVNGQNKLVPSISFELKHLSAHDLGSLRVSAVVRRLGAPDE